MHSTIYQIDTNPIAREKWPNEYEVTYCNPRYVDYCVTESEDDRRADIQYLVEEMNGMFRLNDDGESMTYLGGADEANAKYVDAIKRSVSYLTQENVFSKLYSLQYEIDRPLGGWLFIFGGDICAAPSKDFLSFLSDLTVGDTVYIGAVLDYHL